MTLFTVPELAAMHGITVRGIHERIKVRKVQPARKVGRCLMFNKKQADLLGVPGKAGRPRKKP